MFTYLESYRTYKLLSFEKSAPVTLVFLHIV